LIARLLPEDAAGITRRAVEAALLARAIHFDPENRRRWEAFEERAARWDARTIGERPERLHTGIKYPPDDERVTRLSSHLGLLSDAYVHLTPELMLNLDWHSKEVTKDVRSVHLSYFTREEAVIKRELLSLAGAHATIIDLFDVCYEGAFRADPEWKRQRSILDLRGARLSPRMVRNK